MKCRKLRTLNLFSKPGNLLQSTQPSNTNKKSFSASENKTNFSFNSLHSSFFVLNKFQSLFNLWYFYRFILLLVYYHPYLSTSVHLSSETISLFFSCIFKPLIYRLKLNVSPFLFPIFLKKWLLDLYWMSLHVKA